MAGLPPSAEAATTEGVAQAEAESIQLSPLSTPSIPNADAAQQRSGHSPSSGSDQSRRSSGTWTIIALPFVLTFYSLGHKSSDFLRRYKTSIYKHSLKVLGVFCGIGALTLAWVALNSPMKPNDIDIQSLAAMNRSAASQMAINEALQQSLNKLQEELNNERKQLETDRGLLRNEANQLDLQKWTAQRQFIKECLEYHEAWDEPPPAWSETTFPQLVRRRPVIPSSTLDISQMPSMTSRVVAQSLPMTVVTKYVRVRTSQESSGPSPEVQPSPTNSDTLPSVGDKILVETLLKRGATVDMADADCCTALHYAAANGNTVATELLLRYGADPSIRDKFGAQALFRAAGLTHVEVVKLLIRAGADVDAKDHYGKTALHGSFHDDDVEITELLLDAGANINDRADDGKTPLHRAVEVASLENIRLLLKRGADLNLEDNDQATPLLTAMKGDCKEVSREQLNKVALYLLQLPGIDVNSRSSAAFQEAIAQGQLEVVEAMLVRKVSLNSQGWRCGGTVQAAACNGSAELVSRLLNLDANANIQGGESGTALQAAAFFGHTAILDVLLEHGANVNTRGGRFGYALTAARKGKAKLGIKAQIMRLLKKWGAKEGSVASTHEKERWTLSPSGWVWLPAGTYTVSQTTTIAVDDTGD